MFGFPNAERSDANKFNRNYLKSVIFQIKFAPCELILTHKTEIAKIFRDLLPRFQENPSKGFAITFNNDQTPILQPISEPNNTYELRSQDGNKVLSITNDTISYTVSGKVYEKFESIKEDLNRILETINLCKIETVNRLAIRKLNIIEFQIAEQDSVIPTGILALIINPQLLNNVSYFPNSEMIQQNIHSVSYVNGDNKLNFRYGMILPNIEKKSGQILIDIDLFKTGEIQKGDIISDATDINNEIFNIFKWSICDEAIKYLKE